MAWISRMRKGEFVSGVNRTRVRNLSEFQQFIASNEGTLMLKFHRNGEARFTIVG